jgi:hypothetical protein
MFIVCCFYVLGCFVMFWVAFLTLLELKFLAYFYTGSSKKMDGI